MKATNARLTNCRPEQRAASVDDRALAAENARLRAENEHLLRAMVSRPVIDQARGMLMALAPCSSERAWRLLVDVSQHSNVKLREVAADLVASMEGRELQQAVRLELRRELALLRNAAPR
ncbi:ANTAR domain-containing protein [Streptomyces coryli]|uniref:ANTAR domain-containing protein n=1 Tax=Streptomyces coryli TaxID=1128680 RepID=UPI001F106DDB|nr:ANTAR domain-containing protein [Streptomyces coryli]